MKRTIKAIWAVDGQDMVLRFPNALEALKTGELVASSTGQSASPVDVLVPALPIRRESGDKQILKFHVGRGDRLPLYTTDLRADKPGEATVF